MLVCTGCAAAYTGTERAVIMKAIAAKVREVKPTLATMEATNAGKPFPEV
jgi:acyl-CoA reductase-like NAD-dependent aldehyde dehydrogenase